MALGLNVSPKAVQEIHKLLAKRGKPAKGLRIGVRGGGCTGFGYLFEWCDEEPRATDKVFEFAADGSLVTAEAIAGGVDRTGNVKVFCDPKSLVYLDGTTLDYVTSLMGHGFKFINPNVKGECGCGESVQF